MRATSIFVSSVAVLAATLGIQQLGVFAAPATSPPESPLDSGLTAPVSHLNKSLVGRAPQVLPGQFIGYHGTNAANANAYQKAASKGGIPVPPAFNGADAELGPGIYVTDDLTVAQFFAQSSASANQNKGNTKDGANVPAICAVVANNKVANDWVNNIIKVFIPVNEIAKSVNGKNDPAKLAAQEKRIAAAHGTPTTTVRFSALNIDDPNNSRTGNQLVIPSGVQNRFSIPVCVPVTNQINQFPGQIGQTTFPTFNYQKMKAVWRIV